MRSMFVSAMNRSNDRAATFHGMMLAAIGIVLLLSRTTTDAAEPSRIWVDVHGRFAQRAVMVKLDASHVWLRREDETEIRVRRVDLSDQDRAYLASHPGITDEINALRGGPPSIRPLRTAPAFRIATESWRGPVTKELSREPDRMISADELSLPDAIDADPPPFQPSLREAEVELFAIDTYQDVSAPIAITINGSSVDRADGETAAAASLLFSIAKPPVLGLQTGGAAEKQTMSPRTTSSLVRCDPHTGKAFVSYRTDERFVLMDHHDASGHTLLSVGRRLPSRCGTLAVLGGWRDGEVHEIARFDLPHEDGGGFAEWIQEAKFVDGEHLWIRTDRGAGLWHWPSGRAKYVIQGLNRRTRTSISGGRRLIAIGVDGGVRFHRTEDGEPLGEIPVDDGIPAVAFSPNGDHLAIAGDRRLRIWNLEAAALEADVRSDHSLGRSDLGWLDPDWILTGSGTLISMHRSSVLFRYDLRHTRRIIAAGHVALVQKQDPAVVACVAVPESAGQEAIRRFDRGDAGETPVGRMAPKMARHPIGEWR